MANQWRAGRQAPVMRPLRSSSGGFPDLRPVEKWVVVPGTLFMFALVIYPQFFLGLFHSTVAQMARLLAHP